MELPDCMQEYWKWFIRLNNRRPASMGLSSISYEQMLAFFELIGVIPQPFEVELIEMFDNIAMRILSEQAKKEQQRAQSKRPKKA